MKKNMIPLSLIVASALLVGCSQKHPLAGKYPCPTDKMDLPLLAVEDFDQPCPEAIYATDPEAWEYTTDEGRTVISLTRASQFEPPHRSPFNFMLLNDYVVTDFVFDAWIRLTVPINNNHRDMVLIFGYQDPAHFYYAHMGLKADATAHAIHIVNDAPRTAITKERTEGTPWTPDYHHVRAIRCVETGMIEIYFDDMNNPVMTAEDKTFTWGKIGVGTFDDRGNIDKIVLWGEKAATE